jgi:predicted small metal-binding protein
LIEKEEGKGSVNPQKYIRYSSNADSCGDRAEDQSNQSNVCIATVPNQNTEELFRQITRHMAEEKELTRVRRAKQNCFFQNLKKKLQKEIIHID